MAILIDSQTKLLCQGFTGKQATFYSERAIALGTNVVGGVTPGKGGSTHLGLPVFDSVAEAIGKTGANATLILVPPTFAAAAILEAIDAQVPLIVCVTERIPILDMVRVRSALVHSTSRLLGPNCPGVVTPDQCKVGIMPLEIFKPGCVGIVSRSSTLTYEAVIQTSKNGLGQSTCVGIGADPVGGVSFVDVLKLFEEDKQTEGIVLVGEIGGTAEEQVADYLANTVFKKPIVGYIAGHSAPHNRRMGHAGAIQKQGIGTASGKKAALELAGVTIANTPINIGKKIFSVLNNDRVVSQ
ncbi:UNVERIFIED_CONTAM: hypothetical protein GTU68_063374 [Idotea baltica]|nr:hypothetical protein [Idotea baltica]